MTNRKFALILALLLTPLPSGAERIPILDRGMSYTDVVKLWGAPVRKQQFETMRKDVWHFPNGRVSFVEGRVRDWAIANAEVQAAAAVLTNRAAERKVRRSLQDTASDPAVVEEILEEIMREAPGGSDDGPQGLPSP